MKFLICFFLLVCSCLGFSILNIDAMELRSGKIIAKKRRETSTQERQKLGNFLIRILIDATSRENMRRVIEQERRAAQQAGANITKG